MTRPARRRPWVVTVAAVAGIAVTASMGQWQVSRAAYKRALHDDVLARQSLAPLDNAALAGVSRLTDAQHRRVHLNGRWLERHTVYVDNRMLNGRPGFQVLTPLLLDAVPTPRVLLVQRGWVLRDVRDPTALPRVETPAGVVEVEGRIAGPPSRMLELDTARPTAGAAAPDTASPASGSSAIRQNLDLHAYAAESGLAMAVDGIVLQTGAASEGLSRAWPEPGAGIEKHYGYAFQWFGLSGLIAVLYVWFQFIVPRRRARHR